MQIHHGYKSLSILFAILILLIFGSSAQAAEIVSQKPLLQKAQQLKIRDGWLVTTDLKGRDDDIFGSSRSKDGKYSIWSFLDERGNVKVEFEWLPDGKNGILQFQRVNKPVMYFFIDGSTEQEVYTRVDCGWLQSVSHTDWYNWLRDGTLDDSDPGNCQVNNYKGLINFFTGISKLSVNQRRSLGNHFQIATVDDDYVRRYFRQAAARARANTASPNTPDLLCTLNMGKSGEMAAVVRQVHCK